MPLRTGPAAGPHGFPPGVMWGDSRDRQGAVRASSRGWWGRMTVMGIRSHCSPSTPCPTCRLRRVPATQECFQPCAPAERFQPPRRSQSSLLETPFPQLPPRLDEGVPPMQTPSRQLLLQEGCYGSAVPTACQGCRSPGVTELDIQGREVALKES